MKLVLLCVLLVGCGERGLDDIGPEAGVDVVGDAGEAGRGHQIHAVDAGAGDGGQKAPEELPRLVWVDCFHQEPR